MTQEIVSLGNQGTVTHGRPEGASVVEIENAYIFYKNFRGQVSTYNAEGKRNFGCALTDEAAEYLKRQGWNVKELRARDEGEPPKFWLPVEVSYKNRPPRVVVITRRFNHEINDFEPVRTTLPEDLVEMLDYADIDNVDLTLNPYPYNVNGRSGIKAYLRSIYVTIRMDAFEEKYAAVKEVTLDGETMLALDQKPFDDEIIDAEILEDEG